ncbi:hypothetical protein FB451DRAFT_1178187 [Mycena latifolia]|nr:hypothetical protein FB451DRAFT_1178187 [Mycena latifolia]
MASSPKSITVCSCQQYQTGTIQPPYFHTSEEASKSGDTASADDAGFGSEHAECGRVGFATGNSRRAKYNVTNSSEQVFQAANGSGKIGFFDDARPLLLRTQASPNGGEASDDLHGRALSRWMEAYGCLRSTHLKEFPTNNISQIVYVSGEWIARLRGAEFRDSFVGLATFDGRLERGRVLVGSFERCQNQSNSTLVDAVCGCKTWVCPKGLAYLKDLPKIVDSFIEGVEAGFPVLSQKRHDNYSKILVVSILSATSALSRITTAPRTGPNYRNRAESVQGGYGAANTHSGMGPSLACNDIAAFAPAARANLDAHARKALVWSIPRVASRVQAEMVREHLVGNRNRRFLAG